MNRIVVMVVSVILTLVVAAPLAFAQSQGGAPETVDETPFVLPPLGDKHALPAACEFPVLVESSGKQKALELPGERIIFIFPDYYVTLTNVDEPTNQVTLNVTGSLHQTTLENGNEVTVVTGRNLLGDPKAGFVLAVGTFSYVFDAKDRLIQPLTGEGQLTDVCTLLS
jgi:hypothetical protein